MLTDLAALRAMDWQTLVRAYAGSWNFNPALDGVLIPEHPLHAIRGGRHADVPLIAGFNHDEGAVFPAFGGGTPKGLNAAIAQYYRRATRVAQAYFQSADDREASRHGHEVFGDELPRWPRYVPGTDSVLLINGEQTLPGPVLFGDRLALLTQAWDLRKT